MSAKATRNTYMLNSTRQVRSALMLLDTMQLSFAVRHLESNLDFEAALAAYSGDLHPAGEVLLGGVGQGEAGVILLVQQHRLHLSQLVVPAVGVAVGATAGVALTSPDAWQNHTEEVMILSEVARGCSRLPVQSLYHLLVQQDTVFVA